MKKFYSGIIGLSVVIVFLILTFSIQTDNSQHESTKKLGPEKVRSTSSPKGSVKSKKARAEYFFKMLRDPATNRIPQAIRQKELEYAKVLQQHSRNLSKAALSLTWKEVGPNDVGGRTRALAVDVTNPNTILAGGVSGGMWKSTDNGETWKIKSTPAQILSVTSIAQDRRPGYTKNWYYVCGEITGGSVSANGSAWFSGDGVYKSTDNGESWVVLPGTIDNDLTDWQKFDYCMKVIVTKKGSILIATAGHGIYRSTDGGKTFSSSIGGPGEHVYSDVAETTDGVLLSVVSTGFSGVKQAREPGVYKSTDDGASWIKITPATFPASHMRSTIATAPSNPDIAYILTDVGELKDDRDDVRFHKINLKTGASEDRSANMPDFDKESNGIIYTQGSYNLTLAVKPDDENLVIIGATSLFRSMDAFASKPTDARVNWIGGYHKGPKYWEFYPGLHPDIHSFAFDLTDPKKVWFGHDGGLSYTTDITRTDYAEYFPWEKKNNSYNVTQFYMVTIPDEANDSRIMGGTQDNGTPFFTCDGNVTSKSSDISTGDGAWAYFGDKFLFTSAQNGSLIRYRYTSKGEIDEYYWASIYPKDATDQLFINPYEVDPSNEDVIYYPAGTVIWINRQIGSLPDYTNGTMQGWEKMPAVSLPKDYTISSIGLSRNNPSSTLYYGAFAYEQKPKLYKLENAQTATSGAKEISIPQAASGSYIHNICVNPDDGKEIMVVMSNYNIVGLYHSKDGGETYTAVEGNLTGNSKYPGPSLRAASILQTEGEKIYLLATSIGVFSTTTLDGNNTVWKKEGESEIGNTVVNYILSRKSDGRIAAGTHGRGIFLGNAAQGGAKALASVNVSSLRLQVRPGQTTAATFTLENKGNADLNYNISAGGQTASYQQSIKTSPQSYTGRKIGIPHEKRNQSIRSLFFEKNKIRKTSNSNLLTGTDLLVLDDGNESADTFYGYIDSTGLVFVNEFDISGFDFLLDGIKVFLRSEESPQNDVVYAVLDDNLKMIYYGFKTLDKSANGAWFTLPIDTSLIFKDGQRFFLWVDARNMASYPAGFDENAKVKNKSYYLNSASGYLKNMNTIAGAENGAFLIRATGTKTSGVNKPPTVVYKISKEQAKVNESITFDASGSFDPDGQIVACLWTFGDGAQSDQKVATHAYTQPGTYQIGLKLTDNNGATAEKTGQIIITASGEALKLTVSPSGGTLAPGSSQTVTVSLNAEGLKEGEYTGMISITSNGGNIQIPVQVIVSSSGIAKEKLDIPGKFELLQNYPNPFNPETIIRFNLPEAGHVTLKVHDVNGREVRILLDDFKIAGEHVIRFNGLGLSSGVYYYSIKSGNFATTKKMVYIK